METQPETPTPEPITPPALDRETLLARIDARLRLWREWLSHDHGDELYWWARDITPAQAQSYRWHLRQAANLLHVARATARGRIHGTRFATLDDQRSWLAAFEQRACTTVARCAGLPDNATLAKLDAGELPL